MTGRLEGKVSIVTGGSLGIGRAVARAFLAEGSRCVLAARGRQRLRATVRELSSIGPAVASFPADVGNEADVRGLVEYAERELGPVDALVNCAGVLGPAGPAAETDARQWWETLRTNLLGTFLCTRAVTPGMVRRGRGRIVNISGGGATSALPGFSAYACSKAAVVRLTETVAEELRGTGVCVNAIAPGAVDTRMREALVAAGGARPGEPAAPPERAAELAVYLASEASAGLTGRLISAVWDDWRGLTGRIPEVMATDLYTLRRVVEDGDAAGPIPRFR